MYTVGPIASFSPDVFGATSRRVEEQASLARYRAFELAAAQRAVAKAQLHAASAAVGGAPRA